MSKPVSTNKFSIAHCPFCTHKNPTVIPFPEDFGLPWRVTCGSALSLCGARGPAALTACEAVTLWNRGVSPFWVMEKLKIKRKREEVKRRRQKARIRKHKKMPAGRKK